MSDGSSGVDLTKRPVERPAVSLDKTDPPPPNRHGQPVAQPLVQVVSSRFSPVVLAVVGLAVVVVVATSAVVVSLRGSADHAGPANPASTLSMSRGASASASPGRLATAEASTARSVAALLSDSARSRAQVVAAAQALAACSGTSQTADVFDRAAAARRSLVSQARSLDTSALPETSSVLSTFEQAWTMSARADDLFAQSARSGPSGDPTLTHEATILSQQSHPLKARAAALWNDVALRYGLATVDGLAL